MNLYNKIIDRLINIKPITIFVAITGFFYIDKILLGPFTLVRIHDVFDGGFVRHKLTTDLLLENGFFGWYPHYLGGMPVYAWAHSPLHIVSLITAVFPLWFVYSLMCFSVMVLAGYGMFRLMKEYFELTHRLAMSGGIFFSLITQIQPNSVPLAVLNYVFPIFFVWIMDVVKMQKNTKYVAIVGINLILLAAFPVLSLPFFAILHLGLIFVLSKEQSLEIDFKKVFIISCIVWLGYILTCLPLLYSLWNYIPFVARQWPVTDKFSLTYFIDFIDKAIFYFRYTNTSTLTFMPMIAGLALIAYSNKLRRIFLLWIFLLLTTAFFSSKLSIVLGDTIFSKMDLAHMSWTLPFCSVLFVFVAVDELLKNRKHLRLYLISSCLAAIVFIFLSIPGESFDYIRFFVISKIMLVIAWILTGEALYYPVIREYKTAVIIANCYVFIFSAIFITENIFKAKVNEFVDKVGLVKIKCFVAGLLILHFVTLMLFFKLSDKPLINSLLFFNGLLAAMILIIYISYIFVTPKHLRKLIVSDRGYFKFMILAGVVIVLVCQVRILRFNGLEPEMNSYKLSLDEFSILDTIKTEYKNDPYRVGAVGGIDSFALSKYGFETIDGRGPIMSKNYKDYFKLIIKKQLADKKDEEHFDSYWYDLLLKSRSGKNELNFQLLSLANVRYLMSDEYNKEFADNSKRIIQSKRDYSRLPFYIYELKDVLKRGFLVKNAEIIDTVPDMLNRLSAKSLDALRNGALFYKEDVERMTYRSEQMSDEKFKENRLLMISYAPDKLVFDVSLQTPAILVVSNNFHPNWHATVNGIEAKIFRAYQTFQAVFMGNAGSFRVVFEFRDKYLWLCHIVMMLGFLIINLALLSSRIRCNERVR
jgi:hypothetical protein